MFFLLNQDQERLLMASLPLNFLLRQVKREEPRASLPLKCSRAKCFPFWLLKSSSCTTKKRFPSTRLRFLSKTAFKARRSSIISKAVGFLRTQNGEDRS